MVTIKSLWTTTELRYATRHTECKLKLKNHTNNSFNDFNILIFLTKIKNCNRYILEKKIKYKSTKKISGIERETT